MYKTARSERNYFGSKAKAQQKQGRAHLSNHTINIGGSMQGYESIMSLHIMFLKKAGLV